MDYIWLLVAYLLGAIPFALLVGQTGYGMDIREHGSGNLGTTNTFRILGKKAGILVLIGDVFKGTLAVCLALWMNVELDPVWFGVAAVIGHCYSIYIRFHGGKAVATSAGVLVVVDPILFISAIVVFFLTLALFKMVSLSSILAAVYASVHAFFFGEVSLQWMVCILMVVILYRHRTNIKRIFQGEEEKITDFLKKKAK